MSPTRRQFLGAGAAGFTTGGAGCLSTLPPLGREIRYGRVDVPEPNPPTYRRWIPAPSVLRPYYDHDVPDDVMYGIPGRAGSDVLGSPAGIARGFHIARTDYVGIDYGSYDAALTNGAAFVGEAAVDREAVAATLDRTRYERDGTYEAYDVYTRSDVPRAVAVGGDAVLNARGDDLERVRGRVEATVDAAAGRVERRHEVDAEFATLLERTGARPFTWLPVSGFVELPVEPITGSTAFTFDDDAGYFIYEFVYADASDRPSESAIKRALEEERRARESMQTDVELDGRFVTIEMRMDAAALRAESGDTDPIPHVTWGVDHDPAAGEVTFHHEAGQRVPADRLSIDPADAVRGSDPFADRTGTIGPGDSVSVDLSESVDRLRIQWESDDGKRMSVVFDYETDG